MSAPNPVIASTDTRIAAPALAAPSAVPDLSLGLPDRLRRSFRTVILATRDEHAAAADGDDGTLVVAYDWLSWRRLGERGVDCIYFETAFAEAPLDDPEVSDVFVRANDWVFDGAGRDVTQFRGVSLGKLFVKELSYLWLFHRLHTHALNWLCDTFTPEAIVAHDLRSEFLRPDTPVLRAILEDVAGARGVRLFDRLAPASSGDADFQPVYDVRVYPEPRIRTAARTAFATVLEILSRTIDFLRRNRRPMVLLLPTGAMARGLTQAFDADAVQPLLIADQVSKDPKRLAADIGRGIAFGSRRRGRLSRRDRRDVEEVITRIRERLNAGAQSAHGRALKLYAEQRVLASGRIWDYALDVKQTDDLLRRHPRVRRVVTSGIAGHRIFMELARRYGIGVDFLPHGVYFTAFGHEPLCGDRFTEPGIDRVLTWGRQIESWLDAMGACVTKTRIGHPGYRGFETPGPFEIGPDTKVLVLPCAWNISDCGSPGAETYENLVRTIHALKALGVGAIKVKLHPGVRNADQYREIIDRYDLGVELHQHGALSDYVAWADVVVGTAWSSSLLETVANGTPYVPLIKPRSGTERALLGGLRVFWTPEDVVRELRSGGTQDWDAVMDAFLDHRGIGDPSARFWSAMQETLKRKGNDD